MTTPNGKMKFAVFLMADSNYHIAGWRHPDAYVDRIWTMIEHDVRTAVLDEHV